VADEKDILPLDDELVDYVSSSKHFKEDTERKMKQTSEEFEEMGEVYLQEIEQKNKIKKLKQLKLISYILKHRGDIHNRNELISYSFKDVQDIYDDIKKEKKPAIIKIFHFIFNIEQI